VPFAAPGVTERAAAVHLSRSARHRLTGSCAAVVTALALLGAPTASATPHAGLHAGPLSAAPKPPPAPKVTQGQVDAAANTKTALAGLVGQLGGQIAQAQAQLQQLRGQQEQAEQLVAYRMSQLGQAREAAIAAQQKENAAKQSVVDAHAKFVQYLQATYMSGDVKGTTGSLLTADDPSAMLERNTLEQYEAENQIDAVGALQAATVAQSNADAGARRAVLKQTHAAAAAKAAQQAADAAVASEQSQEAILQNTMASKQHELDTAQAQLVQVTNGRVAYVRYQSYLVEQARIRAARAAAERARQAALARMAAEKAAAAAAAHRQHRSGGGSGGGGNGGGGGGAGTNGGSSTQVPAGPSAPSGGSWTATKGSRAASRALSQRGVPYAWAGGGAYGPSRGVCDASNGAPNDCYVDGFDCSGLAMYAWGQPWAHYAATQYSQAGSYHPSTGNLMPGDLLFWSFNGRVSGIHHVAIYIGHGQIVQAPESNDVVRVTSMYDPGYIFGATRPLT
jgi:peptidoglycan DL-endopeptidase RipA